MSHRRLALVLAALGTLSFAYGAGPGAQPALIANPSFSAERPKRPGVPASWQTFAHEGQFRVSIDNTGGREEGPCLRVEGKAEGRGARAGAFIRTPAFVAPRVLRVSAWTKGVEGRRSVRFQFFDAANPGEIASMATVPIKDSDAEFRQIVEDVLVPKDLRQKQVMLHVMLYMHGSGRCFWDDVGLELRDKPDLKVFDRATSPSLVQPHPPDGADAHQNPPDFRWRPERWADTYTLELCQSPDFTGPTRLTFDGIKYNCFNLPKPLAAATWHWRYRLNIDDGLHSAFGQARSFHIGDDLPVFTAPAMAEIRDRLGLSHPRVYVNAETLGAFRARRLGDGKDWWAAFAPQADRWLKREPAAEPVDCDLLKLGGPLDLNYFKVDTKLRRAAGQVTAGLWNLAFAYLVSGEPRYAEGAKRFLLHVSRWDPKGVTSFRANDQVFRDILIKSAMAYDWIHDALSPEERAIAQKAVADRARIMFGKYARNHRVLNQPYDSHGQTNIGFMGLVALAVAGDVPEADEWLDYTVKVYASSFPPWGAADGGWSQGVTYWKYSCRMAFMYVDALRSATGIDLYRKPWYRQNGYFKMYCHPPWCTMAHFGDTGPSGPGGSDRNNLAHYAAIYRDPYFQWYADCIPGGRDSSPYGYFFYASDVDAKPPFDLPQARAFHDIGWVAMHSRLYAPDDVMLMAKASWYGSCSHSHADQNSFVVYAYGEPLAIDSGYYPWWMSPHHAAWSLQTKAHNCILVDGEGQPIQDITAKGRCVGSLAGPGSAYWVGEAAPAYPGKLDRFRRHIAFLPPDLFVIYDELAAAQPARFQWTLHALEKMAIDGPSQSVLIQKGGARLLVKHVAPEGLVQSQHDDFGVPPEKRRGITDKQWHYTAETPSASERAEFVTVMQTFRSDQRKPGLEATVHADGESRVLSLRSGDREVTLCLGAVCVADPKPRQFDRSATMIERRAGAVVRFMLANGTQLASQQDELVSASQPISMVAKQTPEGWRMKVMCGEATTVRLRVGGRPQTVKTDGEIVAPTTWSYDGAWLSAPLAAGEHALEVLLREPVRIASGDGLRVQIAGQAVDVRGGVGRSANDTQVAWASLAAKPGAYRVKLSDAGRSEIWLNRDRLADSGPAMVQQQNTILVESALGTGAPAIAFEPMYAAGQGVKALPVSKDDPRLAAGLKVEAESYAEGVRGRPSIYSHRTFLSGGKGVSTPALMGIGARWRVKIEREGDYEIVWKVATHESHAERAILVDDKPVAAGAPVVRFHDTSGYGGTPGQWRHYVVAGRDGQPAGVHLTRGEHRLEMVSVAGLLNLDYFVLVAR